MPTLRLYRTASFDKRCNIYCHLLAKEYSTQSSHRRIHHILGTLITRGNYTFQKSWSKVSKKHIACDGRLAFFDNYENCIDCGSPQAKPVLKFKTQKGRPEKIEDAFLMEGFPETVNLPHKGYKGSLFALTKSNYLLRLDLENGHLLEEIYLGPTSVRFKRILWNVVDESFTLCSTQFPRQPVHFLRQAGLEVTDVIQLTLMSCMPLNFVCKLAVTRQIFGRDAVDAAIFLNLLMVMHSTNYVRMYSLERILEESCTEQTNLYDKMKDGTRYGVYPSQLTLNVQLEERPPCLFEVRCRNRDVMLTMPPCYYVMWPCGKSNGYCCFSFETHEMVEGGCLVAEDSVYEERVSLHADDSGRIIHMKNSELRVMKLEKNYDNGKPHLVEDFVIDFCAEPKVPEVQVSQSGRIIKKRVKEDSSQVIERTALTMVYNEDQDMMVVVSTTNPDQDQDELGSCAVVGFYDNWNGKLLRQFVIEELDETLERSICFNLDTITHVFKTAQGKFECHVYKLQPMLDMQDEFEMIHGSKNKRPVKESSVKTPLKSQAHPQPEQTDEFQESREASTGLGDR